MTPEELRKLADEATPGPWGWRFGEDDPGWTDHGPWLETVASHTEKSSSDDYTWEQADARIISSWGHDAWGIDVAEADARLIALAPDLARMCAELGEALRGISKGMDSAFTSRPRVEAAEVQAARAALAKLAELEAR